MPTALSRVVNKKFAISRVLCFQWSLRVTCPPTVEATIIYLGDTLLRRSSDQPERAPGRGRGLIPLRSS